jgi:hypothetical protein
VKVATQTSLFSYLSVCFFCLCALFACAVGSTALAQGSGEPDSTSQTTAFAVSNELILVPPPYNALPEALGNAALASGRLSSLCSLAHLATFARATFARAINVGVILP